MIVHILFNAYFNRGYDCAMVGHTQFFLWSRYSYIISLLTITVRGVSNKHCLLPFFIYSFCLSFVQSSLEDSGNKCHIHEKWLKCRLIFCQSVSVELTLKLN